MQNATKQNEHERLRLGASRPGWIAIACLITGHCLLSGCTSMTNWPRTSRTNIEREKTNAPTKRTSLRKLARNVELETRFVQIKHDPSNPDQIQSLWQWCDETILPNHTRDLLAKNGLRIGRVVQRDRLKTRLESLRAAHRSDVVDEFLSSASVASRQKEGMRVDPVRIGKRTEFPVSEPISGRHVTLVVKQDDILGQTLLDPQFLFAITPRIGPSPGTIRLSMRPEIQHGEMKQDWVQGDGALRIDTRRLTWSLHWLEFEIEGSEEDLFVIAETGIRKGLGRQMFGDKDANQMEQQTVLLLRVANIPTPSELL